MARKNRYGEPWRRVRHDADECGLIERTGHKGKTLLVVDECGFITDGDFRRAILCVNACAGRTKAELKRGVVPIRQDGG